MLKIVLTNGRSSRNRNQLIHREVHGSESVRGKRGSESAQSKTRAAYSANLDFLVSPGAQGLPWFMLPWS